MREWSGHLAAVAEYCGEECALAMAEAFAGTQVYVPRTLQPTSLPGLDRRHAEALVAQFGGDTLTMPSRRSAHRDTAEEVKCLHDAGLTVKEIAMKLGYSQSWVTRMLKRTGSNSGRIAHRDDRQITIFDIIEPEQFS